MQVNIWDKPKKSPKPQPQTPNPKPKPQTPTPTSNPNPKSQLCISGETNIFDQLIDILFLYWS